MTVSILFILLGLGILVAGGELLVRGATGLAEALGVSPLLIGLVLVGFGTSTPELATSLIAAFKGSPGIAVGNVVGSNISNILLILGMTAAILPVFCDRRGFRRDGSALAVASFAFLAAALYEEIGRTTGAIFLCALAGYIVTAYRQERRKPDQPDRRATPGRPGEYLAAAARKAMTKEIALNIALFVGGLGLTFGGAHFLVTGSIEIATAAGISDTIIGLTVVAVGTSLPELVASVAAALRGRTDMAFGNIVGSNIYNTLGILGTTALIHPVAIPAEIAAFDIWAMLGATALLFVFTVTGWVIRRWEGIVMLCLYAAYTGFLAWIAA